MTSRLLALCCSALALLGFFFLSGDVSFLNREPGTPTPTGSTPSAAASVSAAEAESLVEKGLVEERRHNQRSNGKSRFAGQIIDLHTHIHPRRVAQALDLFDDRGIALAVNLLPIPYQPETWPLVMQMEAGAKHRLLHFISPPWGAVQSAPNNFGTVMADNLEAGVKAGARGLKIAKVLGLGLPAPEGGLLAVDDARLAPLWDRAGKLGVPVAIHIGDPVAFWEPLDDKNERIDELKLNPQWSNFGRPLPSHAELMRAQRALFARHPQTTFVAVHVAGFPENLDWVSELLDKFGHVYVDLAARIPALGHHTTKRVRRFFLRHQDRILFGTDLGLSPGGLMLGAPLAWPETAEDLERFYASTWRYLESADKDFEHPTPIQGRWKISGLALPNDVLKKIYFENARRLLGLEKPAAPP